MSGEAVFVLGCAMIAMDFKIVYTLVDWMGYEPVRLPKTVEKRAKPWD
jgi:hypothetical protein